MLACEKYSHRLKCCYLERYIFVCFVANELVKAVIMVLYTQRKTWLRCLA